ncbi:hypothetical protein FPCIR_9322 [Fusarium pseudocircinatum]|uniref:Uncharacterized protein n=1 Tax=Fusarium pseudocircinatum TaxID=56676 RepID=A0A8H5KY67_9HYPO|nr:hypothetical protein FPCIR_9322 [Fusarium pseudocircinatum]
MSAADSVTKRATLLGRYLWSETADRETSDLSVTTPVADSNNRQKVQRTPGRAYARADMGIHRLPEQAVDLKYETPPWPCRPTCRSPLSPSNYVKSDSPPITPRRLAKDTARNDSLPSPASSSESKMMRDPESRPISQEELVAEVKAIYAGLVMVETKCIEVDKAQSTEEWLRAEAYQDLIAIRGKLLHEDDDPFIISSTKRSQNYDLGELLSELSLRSRGFCRLNSRLLPLLQVKKGAPSCVRFAEFMTLIDALSDILSKYILWGVCWMFIISLGNLEPEKFKSPVPTFSPAPATYDFLDNSGPAYYDFDLQSVFMPEPSTTGFDQHPIIDSLLFDDRHASVDPIYLVEAAPQDPDFLSSGVSPRNSAGVTETPSKEDLTGALPAAVTPDPILQSYGDKTSQEQLNPMVNVASVDQGVQNTGQKHTSMQRPALKGRFHARTETARVCNHNPKVSTSSAESDGTEEQSLPLPISTPALPGELQPAERLSEGSPGESSARKRSRSENDDDWSDESLLREMKKKLKRMAQEVKEKEDAYLRAREGLRSIQKTIQVMEDSLRKS